MASSNQQTDAAERNIIYLNELKAVMTAKIQLLKLKLSSEAEHKNTDNINIDQDIKELLTTLITKSNFDTATYNIILKLFISENVINNDSDDPQIVEYKEKLFESLQQLKKSTNHIETLFKKMQNLTKEYREKNEEILKLRNEELIENAEEQQNDRNDDDDETYKQQKEQIMLRVKKINLMITIINGLMHNTKRLHLSDDPELREMMKLCRSEYELK